MPKTLIKILAKIGTLALLLHWNGALALAAPTAEVEPLLQDLAAEKGYPLDTLRQLLQGASRSQLVIDSLDRPAETIHTWKSYRPIFLQPSRIEAGVAYWEKHRAALERAEAVYGVPPEIIVAIIGVETFYGKRPGSIPILDALYTQAYHYPRRYEFGRTQLKAFLQILMEEQMEPAMALGSYAGAMGTPQFIPTSYLSYAVDFDGDGKRDIWGNDADVIGSVANYFSRHNWRPGEAVALPARRLEPGQSFYIEPAQRAAAPNTPLLELAASGIVDTPAAAADDAKATVIHFQGAEGSEFWLGLNNFYVITRYNHSNLYAMAVYQLSQEIRALRARARISSCIRSPLDPAGGVTLFGKGAAIACKACLASGAHERPRYYGIILARALKNGTSG
ncbi:lytic murein transglycosylase B [Sedimenticola hydrogenitrophicus]|uniref:lytic murein transglycosylase B n=1 Tax=Sedimenticola hydrogenitrophicus TaxID=2967975 RepID=UPI0021A31FBE|nr:lytic murein transglycosylase B [Sedimenticola hydrogenitrophicus]